jgi:hypothetical protein
MNKRISEDFSRMTLNLPFRIFQNELTHGHFFSKKVNKECYTDKSFNVSLKVVLGCYLCTFA